MLQSDYHIIPSKMAYPNQSKLASVLNARLKNHGAMDVLAAAFETVPKLALVSSFGAESVVLLHLATMANRNVPVIFIDTQMLFTETLVYQLELAERLRLQNVTIIRAADTSSFDRDGILHLHDPDACCALRKTAPLQAALAPYDGWITGRKRYQSRTRSSLAFFELEEATSRIKVNPLARWSPEDIREYMDENRLPQHPLVSRGYPSIGCAPCTSPVTSGEGTRAGRWRGESKDECGIHFENGKLVHTGATV